MGARTSFSTLLSSAVRATDRARQQLDSSQRPVLAVRLDPLQPAAGRGPGWIRWALTSRGTTYREFPAAEGQVVRSFYLWQVRLLHRSNTYDAFDETLKNGVFFV